MRSTISPIGSALHAGMLAAALGGLDAFVFTAGIGENSPSMRARIVREACLARGRARSGRQCGRRDLHRRADSRIDIYVVPTDEELMIARHTLALLAAHKAQPVRRCLLDRLGSVTSSAWHRGPRELRRRRGYSSLYPYACAFPVAP